MSVIAFSEINIKMLYSSTYLHVEFWKKHITIGNYEVEDKYFKTQCKKITQHISVIDRERNANKKVNRIPRCYLYSIYFYTF